MDAVNINTTFDSQLPRLWVDGDQIRQVAMNLMLNAGAAMPEGGRLVVGTTAGEDGWVKLTFQDSGSGISPENLEKIFEPFFTTKARGTGLGLAITKTIVEQHGGKIEVASEVGKGTTVTVILPANRESL
jgi:two-component system NtrC family sensor kinase